MDARITAAPSSLPGGNRKSPKEYKLTLMLAVDDATGLWNAAAKSFIENPDMTMEDVEETLGPREDPMIEDCLVTMAIPRNLVGCRLLDLSIRPLNDLPRNDRRTS